MDPNNQTTQITPTNPLPDLVSLADLARPAPTTPVVSEQTQPVNEDAVNFHSNGFAQVANGARVGAVSTETFEQRRKLDNGRRIVDNYRFSNMGRAFANLQAKPSGPDVPRSGIINPR